MTMLSPAATYHAELREQLGSVARALSVQRGLLWLARGLAAGTFVVLGTVVWAWTRDGVKTLPIPLLVAVPLSMGLLTERGAPEWHPAPPPLKAACAAAASHCRRKGTDIAQLALQFALSNPSIAMTLVGTANPENLRKNVAWSEHPPDPVLLAEVQAILAPVLNTTWPSGRPENTR